MTAERERELVRDLARQVVELATSEEYEARRQRWRDVNALRKPDRAPVWCRPAAAWAELLPEDTLECEDPLCRSVERKFRKTLIKHDIGDDSVVEPWWAVGSAFDRDTEFTWGMQTGKLLARTDQGGWIYDRPIKTPEDYDRLTIPNFTYNPARTEEGLSRMSDLLGDIMPVRQTCGPLLGAGVGSSLEQLRGMADMLSDLAFRPHLVHRAMAKMTEGVLRAMRVAEDTGLLTPNNHGNMTCSDPIGETEEGKIGLRNLWCSANSQEYQEVSPAMWEEFLLNYQKPIFQQYGLVQYGCCEDLTQKINGLLSIPNLRVFVCSYWTDLGKVIEACGQDYTIMWRQLATDVTVRFDRDYLRRHLSEGIGKLQGHYYQVVLRELQTLGNNPRCLHEWAQIAKQVAEENA